MALQNLSLEKQNPGIDIGAIGARIARNQSADGQIPWWVGGKTDPWDHVEAAMGLAVAGHHERARAAFRWLRGCQLDDGSWYAAYGRTTAQDRTRDANMTAYIAVGLLHYYMITQDIDFVAGMWTTVEKAITFALSLQAPGGEIYWAVSPRGEVDRMALLTGSSSIFMSLKCALVLARLLRRPQSGWRAAARRLEVAIRCQPQHFNMTKSRFAMDWFYPVLCGVMTGAQAQHRIDKLWKKFVVDDLGVRCVSDRPWVTIAESAELVLTLAAMGNDALARIVFNWICDHTFDDGTFWCGFTFPDMTIWPEEKISWTNAVMLMAADALFHLTPAGELFNHRFWEKTAILGTGIGE